MSKKESLVDRVSNLSNGDDFYLNLKTFMSKFINLDNNSILNESDGSSTYYRLDKDIILRIDVSNGAFYIFLKHFTATEKDMMNLNIQYSGKFASTTPFRFHVSDYNLKETTKFIKKYMASYNCYIDGKKPFSFKSIKKKNVKLPTKAKVYIEGKLYGYLDNLKIITTDDKFVARCINDGEKFNLFDRDKFMGYIDKNTIYDTMGREIGKIKR